MKIQTLEYFVVLSESRSINEAAQKLYIPQPSLSKTLQQLENEIGGQLFLRTEHGITLTEVGKTILPQAKEMIENYYSWIALTKQSPLKQIDIYTHCSFPDFILPDVILHIRKKYPEVNITYTIAQNPENYISQNSNKPIFALLPCSNDDLLNKCTKRQGNSPLILTMGQYCCLVSNSSPLADKKVISTDLLKKLYFVTPIDPSYTDSASIGQDIESFNTPEYCINVETNTNVINLVSHDPDTYALSYYPALKRYSEVANGKLIPVFFEGRTNDTPLCLFYSKKSYDTHPIIQDFLKSVKDAVKDFTENM